ncbi:cation:proton antiporter [Gordonia aichiensis]|uniref:Na(+)/H(+)-K(+) antiporter n=1 Tax=Gordonia aichiensis NBRC 108223 TaxID=1220583 RepID=L7KL23_9ACTN|nr:cation:proton antiporter [Gordonia aichiensis]GAC48408.1 Na(+)/H(+)-K(+) antiporter [Gordonia aichiensis NBRC 108223]
MLTALAVVLGTAVVCGAIARRLGFPSMAGELVAGVLLGPSVLGLIAPHVTGMVVDAEGTPNVAISAVGTLAVVLLVGLAATELDARFLRTYAGTIGTVGIVAFVIPLAVGIGIGFVLPSRFLGDGAHTAQFAVLLGLAMSVSAIPVIASILGELSLLRTTLGRLVLSVGTVTDLAAWVALAAVSALATVGLRGWHLPLTLVAVAGSVGVALIARPILGHLMTRFETAGHDTQSAAVMVIAMIAGAAATDAMHLDAVLGAVLAGIACGRRPERVVAPLRMVTATVLAPVFLASAGLHVDLRALASPAVAGIAIGVITAAVVAKLVGGYLGARLARRPRWESVAIASGLNARGVVEIIIATTALGLGIFSEETYMIVVVMAVLTSVMAGPMVAAAARRWRPGAGGSVLVGAERPQHGT